VAGAQTLQNPPTPRRTGYCTGGLFTLTAGEVKFRVALDDRKSEPVGRVVMRLIDHEGTVVKTQTVSLGPGQSATLEHQGSGVYRAQAETFESALDLSDRRTVVGTVELFDIDAFRIVIPVVCSEPINRGKV